MMVVVMVVMTGLARQVQTRVIVFRLMFFGHGYVSYSTLNNSLYYIKYSFFVKIPLFPDTSWSETVYMAIIFISK